MKKINYYNIDNKKIRCKEKNKIIKNNFIEIRKIIKKILGEHIIIGCEEYQIKIKILDLI